MIVFCALTYTIRLISVISSKTKTRKDKDEKDGFYACAFAVQ
ncbi:hypothetical protein [Campylobacter concisus]|nr:hypothetical protein [Campylobacter concisus]